MRSELQTFKSVRERDTDYLLLEELSVSSTFRRWFLHQVGYQTDTEFLGAWHSVSDSELGESDLEFGIVLEDNRTLLIMVENKIDATFQDNQLTRYRKRGEKAVEDEWDDFTTCLFAPEAYLTGTQKVENVDTAVSYEAVRKYFQNQESVRAAFKAKMLSEAIEQNRRGYNSEPDDQVTELHRFYWTVARENYPDLGMEKPKGVPEGNLWVRFKPILLSKDVQLIHKMGRGDVDLQLSVSADQEGEFHEEYQEQLADSMEVVETGKSLSIRISTPSISADKDPQEQRTQIQAGLKAAEQLLDWYISESN